MNETDRAAEESLIARRHMVERQIRRRGIDDERVIEAMMGVPRETFVPPEQRKNAYADGALPVAFGQTISQPYIVAHMTASLALTPACRVLEIGTGTGYQTAILARLAHHVFTVERIAVLQDEARNRLAALGIGNVSFFVCDGSVGLIEHAPFDRIIVTAAAPSVPASLTAQLADGGVLLVPVGGRAEQTIRRVVRSGSTLIETTTLPCRFVQLFGREGWRADDEL
jgi:protein-L-isoaspartate(D-aspartate) O-methyltransferase